MKRKKIAALVLGFLLVFLIPGFLFSEGQQEKQKETTIRFVIKTWDKAHTDNYKMLIDQFMGENPNINIDLVIIPWGQEYEKFTSMIASGDIPHISESVDSETGLFQDLDIMLPLTDSQVRELKGQNLDEVAFNVATFADGKIYNFPWLYWMYAFIYRTDRFEDSGVSVPQTTEDLLATADKLTDPSNGEYGFSWRADGGLSTMMPFLLTYLGQKSWFDENGNCLLDTDEGVEALAYYYDLYEKGAPPEAATWGWDGLSKAFWAGSTSMYANTSETIPSAIKQVGKENIGVFKYPEGPSGKRFNLFSYLGYMRFHSDKQQEDAASWKFMKYLLSEDSLKVWADQKYSVPNSNVRDVIFQDELYKPFKEEYNGVDVTPAHYPYYLPEWKGFEFTSSQDIQAMAIGDKTPQQVGSEWSEKFTSPMKKYMKNHPGFNPVAGE